MWKEAWFLLLIQFVSSIRGNAMILPSFSWDPRNKIFSGGVCGGNKDYAHIVVQEDSQMYFLCPSAAIFNSIQNRFAEQVNMYENMYLVTENEFMKCEFHGTTHDSKKVMDCNSPLNNYKLKYHMFYFSAFTTSDGIPFFPDRTYYFIATSNGSALSLANTHGGRCQTHNMRLAVTVCSTGRKCIKDDTLCKTPKGSSADKINTTTTSTTGVPTTNKPDTTTSTTTTDIDGDGVAKPQVLARHGSPSSGKFGVAAVACLVGGLIAGFIIGFIVVILAQRYSRRLIKKKQDDAKQMLSHKEKTNNHDIFHKDNQAYRNSMVGKRLLSTSSNTSDDRYSVVPPAVVRNPPPAGTIAV